MDIITNERLVKRNARIGQVSSIAGLAVLAGGMVISFTRPEYFGLSMGALLFGFLLSQVGIYFGNRWGRRPRPDEQLNIALKGLDSRYSLYHYSTPANHLLVGPAGVWALLPHNQRGTISYDTARGRWRQRGGNAYLKLFAQEGLGRPDLEIQGEIEAVRKYLEEILPEEEIPAVQAALVFTNEAADVQGDDSPVPMLKARELKEFIRKTAKSKPISLDKAKALQQALPESSLTG
jgi:hypothetical protein